jgi:hypothetical protein
MQSQSLVLNQVYQMGSSNPNNFDIVYLYDVNTSKRTERVLPPITPINEYRSSIDDFIDDATDIKVTCRKLPSSISSIGSCKWCHKKYPLCICHFDNAEPLSYQGRIKNLRIRYTQILRSAGSWANESISPASSYADWGLKLVEDVALLIHYLVKASSRSDYIVAVTTFAKLRIPHAVTSNKFSKTLVSELIKILDHPTLQGSLPKMVDDAYDIFNHYNKIKDSELFQKLYKFSMFALTHSVFESFGITFDRCKYSLLEREVISRKFSGNLNFLHCIIDTLLYILKKGFQVYNTGSLQAIFHSGSSYESFYERSMEIIRKSKFLANPSANGFEEHAFISDLHELIEQGECIKKNAVHLSSSDKKEINYFVSNLIMIKMEYLTKSAARESRAPPLSVLVYGNSGIGKSFIKDLLFYHYGKVKGLRTDKKFCYTRNAVSEFWDGFSTEQWCINFDDIAFMHPNKATQGDPSVMELLQVINAIPFVPNQAELNDKGRTPMRAKLVIATTNTEDLNAHHYFSFPSAVQRRFPYIIEPKVREEYASHNGSLDSTLVPPVTPGQYQDLWTWTIKRVSPVPIGSNCKKAQIDVVHQDIDLKSFLKFFNSVIATHDDVQNKILDSTQLMSEVELCPLCNLPNNLCSCVESDLASQSNTVSLYNTKSASALFAGVSILGYVFRNEINETIDLIRCAYSIYSQGYSWYSSYKSVRDSAKHFLNRSMTKSFWSGIGEKVYQSFNVPYAFAIIATTLTAGMGLYSLFKTLYSEQGNSGVTPVPDGLEKQNVWFKKDFDVVLPEATSASRCFGRPFEEILRKVERNTVSCLIYLSCGTKATKTRAFCVDKQYYVFNSHTVPSYSFKMDIMFVPDTEQVNSNFTVQVSPSQLYRDEEKDLCMMHLPTVPPRSNLGKYIACDDFKTKCNGSYVSRDETGCAEIKQIFAVSIGTVKVGNNYTSRTGWIGKVADPTIAGFCGSPLVLDTLVGPVICGIHAFGGGSTAGCSPLTQSWVETAKGNFRAMTLQSSVPVLGAPSAPKALVTLHDKSVFRFIPEGTVDVYGSIPGGMAHTRSDVSRTIMCDFFLKNGYSIKHAAPELRSYEPWRHAALSLVKPVVNMEQSIIDECIDAFYNDILTALPSSELNKLEVYDTFTAINGAPGVAYVDSINRSTSAGFPWNKSKKNFIVHLAPERGCEEPITFNDEILSRISNIELEYMGDRRVYPVFSGTLKDEPVTLAKAKAKETRVFAGGPIDWGIVVRKYCLSFVRVLQRNTFCFEAGPGTNCHSNEWGQIYKYLTQHGEDRMVAGDYSKFDKRMNSAVILGAFRIIHDLCKASGNFDEDSLRCIRGIATDTAFPMMNYRGDLIGLYGSNPSGHPLTVIINGLVNSIYMRYVYKLLNPEKTLDGFKQNVSLFTYGDDNIMGVSPAIPWYNHTDIQAAFASIDIKYTMADKLAVSVPYIHISEASFLKRKWVYDEDLKDYACPLEHDSINRALTVGLVSKSIPKEEQAIAVLTFVNNEYFFYGRKVHEEKRNLILTAVNELNLVHWVADINKTFPVYDALLQRWKVSSGLITV